MQHNYPFNERPPLWMYHEMSPHDWKRPEYYNLCLETVKKHCGRRFRVIQLTRYNIYSYIPDFRKDVWHTSTRQQRTDLVKWELLARYGGLFLDQDVLVLRDLSPYIEKLNNHDFIAFGKSTKIVGAPHQPHSGITISSAHISPSKFATQDPLQSPDTIGSSSPSVILDEHTHQEIKSVNKFIPPLTWAMASRPRGRLVSLARDRCYWILDNNKTRLLHEPNLFGKHMLWESIHILSDKMIKQQQPWEYFHVSSVCSQCDANDVEYTKDRLLMNEDISSDCVQNMFLVPLGAQSSPCAFPQWFVSAQRDQLLGNGNTLLSKLLRWSLLDETPFNIWNTSVGRIPTVSVPRFYASGWTS